MLAFSFIDDKNGKPTTVTILPNNGRPVQIRPEHPAYNTVVAELGTLTDERLKELLQGPKKQTLAEVSKGRAELKNGVVYFDGKPVHDVVARAIVAHEQKGLPYNYLLLFLENLYQNPSYNSIKELFDFINSRGLTITEDGCFLAYKAIRHDWTDKHTGTFLNKPGCRLWMLRGFVDDNREKHCSKGFHVGGLDYVSSFGNGDDRMVIVKVNPKDAVSVPTDAKYQKLRVCEYTVVREFDGVLETDTVYTNDASTNLASKKKVDNSWVNQWKTTNDDNYVCGLDHDHADDSYTVNDVHCVQVADVACCKKSQPNYHNKRDKFGRFVK